MTGRVSFGKTVAEAYGFFPAGLAGSWTAGLFYVAASAALWTYGLGPMQDRLGGFVGAVSCLIVFVAIYALWAAQALRAGLGKGGAGVFMRDGDATRLFLASLGFGFILFLAAIMSFTAAALFAGSVLVGMEVPLEDVQIGAADEFAVVAERAGPAAAALIALVAAAAMIPPFLAFCRIVVFRAAVIDANRFMVLRPASWTKGSGWTLLAAGVASFGVCVVAALAVSAWAGGALTAAGAPRIAGEAVRQGLVLLAGVVELGFALSVYRQVKPPADVAAA